ncbi:MAG TPA: SPOR domain-containing protein [Thermoanaerobaculia bacterium]|nr:SPOR domain-containing protein [Thermoanaerobaculia bacterium]
MRLPWLAAFCVFLSAAGAPLPLSPAEEPSVASDPDADLLLLGVRIERELLEDIVPAYAREGAVLLSLSALVHLLELDVRVDPQRALAEGTVSHRHFRLDAAALRVTLGDRTFPLSAGEIERRRDDLYVDAELLELWFSAELVVDERAALVTLWPREPLPSRLRSQREGRAAFLGATDPAAPADPRIKVPYRLFAAPFADLTFRAMVGDESAGGDTNHTARISGDLFRLESLLFVSGTREDPLAETRLSLGRRDPNGSLLGPLRATEVVFGESFHPGIELVTTSRSGPGLLLGNLPLGYTSRFDEQTFVGELPPGWEVELYRGDELLAYQSSRADGRYEIRDVPLLFGTNRFRLVFYGPYGDRREVTETYEVGQSLTPPGRLHYRLAANDPDTAVPRGHLELSYGIAKSLSLAFSGAAVEIERGDVSATRGYLQAGLRGTLGRWFTTLDLAGDDAGGSAIQGRLQTRFGHLGVSLEQSFLSSYTSEALPSALGELESRTLLRLDGGVPLFGRRRLPLSLRLRHDRLAAGGSTSEIAARLSASGRGLFVSHELLWSSTELASGRSERGEGRLLLSRYGSGVALRGELAYEIAPEGDPTEISFLAERRLARSFTLSLGARRSLETENTHYLVEAAKRQGAFGFGMLLDYSDEGGLLATATVSVAVAPDPFSPRWHTDAQPLAGMGALAVRVFLDDDGDGVHDPDEESLEGIGFTVDGIPRAERTDVRGLVLLPRVPVHREMVVRIQSSTLEDPLHVPVRDASRLVPRPGRTVVLDFPILSTGEITGTARLEEGEGDWRAGSNLRLQLVDASGRVVAETRTAYDGFYDFARLAPGQYELRLDPDRTGVLGATMHSRTVEVPDGGAILDGVDLEIFGPAGAHRDEPAAELAGIETRVPDAPVRPVEARESLEPVAERRAAAEPIGEQSVKTGPALAFVSPDWQAREPSYGVQVGSYRHRWQAEEEADRCSRALATRCDVARVDLGSLGLWHRVVAGRLAELDEAWKLRGRIARDDEERPIGPVLRVLPPPPEPDRMAPPGEGDRFGLQVASLRLRSAAERLSSELCRDASVGCRVVTVDLGEKGTWHRVIVGSFATRREALALDQRLGDVEGAGPALLIRLASD